MHKLLTLLLMTLIFASCGLNEKKHIQQKEGTRQFAVSDPTFKAQAESFTTYARTYLSKPDFVIGDIPINFGDTENPNFDGVCNTYSNGAKEVIIKKSWWDTASASQREIMIFHELGHCSLNRDHDSELLSKDNYVVKASIMNPTIPGSAHYQQYKTAYLSELFTYNKSPLSEAVGI